MHLCDKGIYDEIKQCTLKIENNDYCLVIKESMSLGIEVNLDYVGCDNIIKCY